MRIKLFESFFEDDDLVTEIDEEEYSRYCERGCIQILESDIESVKKLLDKKYDVYGRELRKTGKSKNAKLVLSLHFYDKGFLEYHGVPVEDYFWTKDIWPIEQYTEPKKVVYSIFIDVLGASTDVRVEYFEDEWFIAIVNDDSYYKCDQIDGLLHFLKENILTFS
jgi:hypothetical protein